MEKFLIPEEFSLDDIFKGKYLVPVYQRPYSWGEKQVKQLLRDIDDAYTQYKQNSGQNADDSVLFTGTIFIKTEANIRNEYTEYTVVDGQQRIATLTLLLMVILNHLYAIDSEDDVVGEIRNYLWKKEERKNDKEKQILTLGNVDKGILKSLFNELYAKGDIITYAKEKLKTTENEIEINLLNNLLLINDHLSGLSSEKDYYDYIDFIKYNIKVISIKINTNMVKLFSIFESINSKGKPLEEIDLIKSYIFQNLNQSDYDEYLEKWGELIERTNDRLSDYLTIYVRGNMSYYRTSIKLENFKTLSGGSLQRYYEESSLSDVLKAFINDMLKQVKYYNMLSNPVLLKSAGVSEQSISVFRMNALAKYNHTEPLFFKLLSLRGDGITDEKFDALVEYAFRFILTFQTISSRESKQTISVFSDVQNEIYNIAPTKESAAIVDDHAIENIKYVFNKKIYENTISDDGLRHSIHNTMTYKKNKNVVKLLLAYLLELGDDKKIDYLKLNTILGLGGNIHVDHILPQAPSPNDANFKYYQEGDFMILKEGQDFVEDSQKERMNQEDFLEAYLHRFGNLRLAWANDNIAKSNHLIKLEEFDELFNCNVQIVDREKHLIDRLINSNLLLSTNNIDYSPSSNRLKRQIAITAENYRDTTLKNYNPVAFALFNDSAPLEKYSYRQLLIQLFDQLYDLEKDRLIELAEEHFYFTSSHRVYISNSKDDIDVPYILGNSVYIETHLSSDSILRFCYKVLDEMGLDSEDFVVILEEK